MSPDRLMETASGRSMKQEALDAAARIENPRPLGRGVRQIMFRHLKAPASTRSGYPFTAASSVNT